MLTSVRSGFEFLKDKPYGPLNVVDKTVDALTEGPLDPAPEIDAISTYLEHGLGIRLDGVELVYHRYYFKVNQWRKKT